jgi:hypothetical protein
MRVRYARAVDIVGGTHDGGGLPNRGGWKGEDVCRSARSQALGGLPEVESSKPSDPALPDFRQLQAKQELRLSQSLS